MAQHVEFGPVISGVWLERPHRFMVRVRLDSGEVVEAHSNNSGSMKSCSGPGLRVLITPSDNPKRTLKYTLRAVEVDGRWVGVDTSVPLKLAQAVCGLPGLGLEGMTFVRREVMAGPGTRFDGLLQEAASGRRVWLEVKNVTLLVDSDRAQASPGGANAGRHLEFPDAVSARAARHMEELATLAGQGELCVVMFVCQRSEGDWVSPADSIDSEFGRCFRSAVASGVRAIALECEVCEQGVTTTRLLPIRL